MFTKGPGAYKIPAFDDVPTDLRISLLKWSANPRAVHSSKAVGEPPLFLGSSVFWAAKRAVQAARQEAGLSANEHFAFDAPVST
jgi:xanthine dehydrogenase/oxidase